MSTREVGAQPLTGLQLVRLNHDPAVAPPSPGEPGERTFILVDDDRRAAGIGGNLTLSQNEVLRTKGVDLWLLRLRRRLFHLKFPAHSAPQFRRRQTRIIYLPMAERKGQKELP